MLTIEKPVTLAKLRSIAIPKRTDPGRWQGIQHGQLADAVMSRAEKMGFKVLSDRWSLARGGAMMIGSVGLQANPKMKIDVPKGLELALGVEHSNDSRIALRFHVGAKVLVCSNGMISQTFAAAGRRKHTKGVVLDEVVDRGLGKFCEVAKESILREVKAMQGMTLNDVRAHHILCEAGARHAFPWSQLGKVEKMWRTPPHPEFKGRDAWSLYNAFTEVAKELPVRRQRKVLLGTRLLIAELGNTRVAASQN